MSVLSPTNFDDNTEDLLHLLTDTWDNPLKATIVDSKWTRKYLTKLTSLPLDELLHEPAQLREEQAKAKRDAQQLAFRDYPSFLHAQTCRHEAEETLDGLDVHLGDFLSSVPELQEACEEFGQHAQLLKDERGKITSVLEHQNVLTDLLEIPQLMETCVWNGYYSEAMDLASHVRLLQVRYPLSVIKSIQQQVQASSDLMLVQLISHLRKPIRLAAAMNVVGFLRRMDVFETETELRMVFLRCRHDFLQQRLVRVKRDISEDVRQRGVDAFEYLKRFVDVMREQMFEIGTQYISIFSNEQGTLLSDYMVHTTGLIKNALNAYLPMIEDTSALASLLTQLQYCGMSLGRIGLDFRHIFVHSFEEAVQPMILRWIDASTEDLVKLIVKSTEEASAPSTWMSSKIVSQNSNNEVRRNAFQPPMLLVGYPLLAIFTNGVLSAFNALRLLPAVSLYIPIQNHLDACFLEIGNALKQYSDQAASHIPDEFTYLQSFAAAYVRCCVPYLKSCLVDGIYGELSIPSLLDDDMELLLADHLPVVKKDVLKEVNGSDLPKKEVQIDDNSIKDGNDGANGVKNDTPCVENGAMANNAQLSKGQHRPQPEEKELNVNAKEQVSQVEEKNSGARLIIPNEEPAVNAQEVAAEENLSTLIDSTKRKDVVINDPVNQNHVVADVTPVIEAVANQSIIGEPAEEDNTLGTAVDAEESEKSSATEEKIKEEEPIIEKPVAEEPVAEEPVAEEPVAEEPVAEEPVAEKPVAEKPVAEEPVAEELVAEEPVAEEPVVEEPIVEEPAVEESAVEESSEKHIINESIVEKPAVEEQSLEEFVVENQLTTETTAETETITANDNVKNKLLNETPVIEENPAILKESDTVDLEPPSVTKASIVDKPKDANDTVKENTQTEELSATEHTDEEHKGEGSIKATPEKKLPKKSKKHKGKKGRR